MTDKSLNACSFSSAAVPSIIFSSGYESRYGQIRHSPDTIIKGVEKALKSGVSSFMLFGVPNGKDENGTGAFDEKGVVQKAVKQLKKELGSDAYIITDVCLCEYTSHGHCGVADGAAIDNDATLPVLAKVALSHAVAGADMVTGRQKIIKFEGCYHGHSDSMLVKAGSGALTLGEPDSLGVQTGVAGDTLIAQYNDLKSVGQMLEKYEVACVITEPVAANMGLVVPHGGFLKGLRELCDKFGALLVFDEVITGFRLCKGGAQEYYGVKADLAVYGKIIGGGMPVGAYGGRKDIMEYISPSGSVYQAGTLSGNPIAMAAGIAQLAQLESAEVYKHINSMGERLCKGLGTIVSSLNIKAAVTSVGSLVCLFFGVEEAAGYQSVKNADRAKYAEYFHAMLRNGVYLPPAQFEAMFISQAHGEKEIDRILNAGKRVKKYNREMKGQVI